MQKSKRTKRPSAQQKYTKKKIKTMKWIKKTWNKKARQYFKQNLDTFTNTEYNKIRDIEWVVS